MTMTKQPKKFSFSPTSSSSAMRMTGQYCLPFEDTYGARNLNWPLLRKDYQYGFRVWCRGCSSGRDEIRQIQIVADDQPAYQTTRVVRNRSTLRRFLLITLNHVERGNRSLVTTGDIITRLTARFTCRSIIICTEGHKNFGYHKHIGVWNETASKNTVQRIIREAFPEFEGRQCNLSTHKVWETVCQYVLKEDKNPIVWGEESLEKVRERAGFGKVREGAGYKQRKKIHFAAPKSKTGETRKIRATNAEVLQRLYTKETWEEVLKDEILGPRCVTNYQNMYRLFLDFQLFKLRKSLDQYLSTPISNFLFPFIRASYVNQTYILSFSFLALLSCFLSLSAVVKVCIPHVLNGFNGDFLTFFTSEFDFVTSTWDFDFFESEPELPPVLDIEKPLSTASGTNPADWGLLVFLAAAIAMATYIVLAKN